MGYSMYYDSFVENDNWEEIVGRCHAHGGTEFSIGSCIPSKYMNQRKPSGSSFHQKSLPYRPNCSSLTIHSGSHGLGPWVTKIIPGFCWIFNGLYVDLNIHRALMLILLVAYPPAWPRSLLHVLWSDRDPCCMSFNLTKILFITILSSPKLKWN